MCGACITAMCPSTTVAPTPKTPIPTPKAKSKKKKKLSDGDKTAIAIGGVFVVILIVVMSCAFCKKSTHYAMKPNDGTERLFENPGYTM
jgi:hypothetical protein